MRWCSWESPDSCRQERPWYAQSVHTLASTWLKLTETPSAEAIPKRMLTLLASWNLG